MSKPGDLGEYVPGLAVPGFPIILRRKCASCGHRRRSFLMYPPRKPRQACWLCGATCATGSAGMWSWRMVDEPTFERKFAPTRPQEESRG
jgi:hypothetical protein